MRIQILPLPLISLGEHTEEPFVFVVDQVEGVPDENAVEQWQRFGREAGARTVLVTDETVEIVDRYAVPALAEPRKTIADILPKLREGGHIPGRKFDPDQRFEDAGEKARQALGIDGTMGDAQDVPHAYDDHVGEAPYCVVCGLARPATIHKRCSNCGKRFSDSACGPGHAMAGYEIAQQEQVTAGWPRLQRDRSEDDT